MSSIFVVLQASAGCLKLHCAQELRTHSRACTVGKCFVPFCKTGYKSCKEKYSLFTPPNEPSRLEAWRRAIPRKYRVLQRTDRVCEKHFAPHFIMKTWSAEIDGHVLMSGKRRAGLAKDAVPSIFEGAPRYLSKKIKSPRKQVKRQAHRVAPSTSTSHSGSSTEPMPTSPGEISSASGVSAEMPCDSSTRALRKCLA
ncbi:hypothetical protein MRX96_008526 [Rhipicephalus microplus]